MVISLWPRFLAHPVCLISDVYILTEDERSWGPSSYRYLIFSLKTSNENVIFLLYFTKN